MSYVIKQRIIFSFLLLAMSMLALRMTQSQAATDNGYVLGSIILVQSRVEELPPEENTRCASYARNAISDYQSMQRHKECLITDNPRWQPNFKNHYQWCLTARPEWLKSERDAREGHLMRCGVLKTY